MSLEIQFWLNNEHIHTSESSGLLVLDYLRKHKHLMGTKEGCKEGDCGACGVMIGKLRGDQVVYEPVTSCLVPLGEMHGKHLVTIEGITGKDLSPVQQAVVDEGGSQCGFCTPGIIVSMTWYVMQAKNPDMDGFKRALSGHLCRCTGYSSLKRAAQGLIDSLTTIWQANDRIGALIEQNMLPAYFQEIPEKLKKIPKLENNPHTDCDFFIAGGTDIYVQKGEVIPDSRVAILNLYPEMDGITARQDKLCIGALTTFEDFAAHPEIVSMIPRIKDYMHLIASLQLRNRATLGGNIVNASPIGDMTILLLALDSELVLRHKENTRTVAMKEFFLGYKQLQKTSQEIVTEIVIPVSEDNCKIHFEKVSKRKCLDIATVNSGVKIIADESGVIQKMNFTLGGVAPIPLYLRKTSEFFVGKTISSHVIYDAFSVMQEEISPISDIRGSESYKRLLAQQFLIAHFTELYPQFLQMEEMLSLLHN